MNVLKVITLHISEMEFWKRTEMEKVQKNRHLVWATLKVLSKIEGLDKVSLTKSSWVIHRGISWVPGYTSDSKAALGHEYQSADERQKISLKTCLLWAWPILVNMSCQWQADFFPSCDVSKVLYLLRIVQNFGWHLFYLSLTTFEM